MKKYAKILFVIGAIFMIFVGGVAAHAESYWSQRLKWFESDIIGHYNALEKNNVLVIGDDDYLRAFQSASEKYKSQTKFSFTKTTDGFDLSKYDLIINCTDAKINASCEVSKFSDVYEEILYDKTLTFLEENGVEYYFFEGPILSKIKNLDEYEKSPSKVPWGDVYKDKQFARSLCGDEEECLDFILNYRGFGNFIDNGKFTILKDESGKYRNVHLGIRKSWGMPLNPTNRICFYGPCIVRGAFVPDDYTISSYMQRFLNSRDLSCYESANYAGHGGPNCINNFEYILHTAHKPGDIMIQLTECSPLLKKIIERHKANYYETSHLFDRPHNYGRWFSDDPFHCNHRANEAIAKYIFDVINPKLKKQEASSQKKCKVYV